MSYDTIKHGVEVVIIMVNGCSVVQLRVALFGSTS